MERLRHSQLLIIVAIGKQGTGTLMFSVGDTANVSVSNYIAPSGQSPIFPVGFGSHITQEEKTKKVGWEGVGMLTACSRLQKVHKGVYYYAPSALGPTPFIAFA